MAQTVAKIRGTLTPDGKIELDHLPPIRSGPVEVTVEPVSEETEPPRESVWVLLDRIHAEQRARGFQPRTKEEIDAEINALRDEAEERIRATEALQAGIAREKGQRQC